MNYPVIIRAESAHQYVAQPLGIPEVKVVAATEAEAIRKVFGNDPPPVTSTKGVTGHLIGAAGALEAAIALLSLRDGIVPPTANLDQLGDDIELDVVAGDVRAIGSRPVLSNSFGFGGHNATLILAPPTG